MDTDTTGCQSADWCLAVTDTGQDSSVNTTAPGPERRSRFARRGTRLACVLASIALAGGGGVVAAAWHPEIIKAALGVKENSGTPQDQSSTLWVGADTLSSDALMILIPVVSLASAIGGIMWALGSQRGQGIVIGALIAGVSVVMIKTIVQ
jgi:hypothetical protein